MVEILRLQRRLRMTTWLLRTKTHGVNRSQNRPLQKPKSNQTSASEGDCYRTARNDSLAFTQGKQKVDPHKLRKD